MDALTISGIVVFLGCALALYLTRKVSTRFARLLLVGCLFAVAGGTIYHYENNKQATEAVWHKDAIQWRRLPIGVWWDKSEFAPYNETIYLVLSTWNRRSGCQVLREALTRDSADIVLRTYDGTSCGRETLGVEIGEKPNVPAWGRYCSDYFDAQFKRLDDIRPAFRIILHEVGHGIGLDHDADGAMAKEVLDPSVADAPEYLLPNDKDVKAIAERFCN